MSNEIFKALAKDRIEKLKQAYNTSKEIFWDSDAEKLIHPGEFGEYREKSVIELIELFIPQNLKISEGFIITSNGEISTQCDIIVYDPNSCPKLVDSAHQKFFPVECVIAVGEVKSNIRSPLECSKIINKLAKIKKLKESIVEPSPYRIYKNRDFNPAVSPFDNIYTFVICKHLPKMPKNGYTYGSDIEYRHRHNLLIGIDNGYACYLTKDGKNNIYYPQMASDQYLNLWKNIEVSDIELPSNFGQLLTSLYNHCQVATLLDLDIVRYWTDNYTDDLNK
ncbi:DUF6602 domain-containing protein [Photobacterium damselae]|uniref:DUF6602 domain-containing protein n=1 Tax=Photobacterium damselae TaxID=38293 RepID=UPI000D04E21E|nr:DUF6602 domain-containing protein [Photobacterium damselae]AWK82585.1 hypothetical protein BST98_11245 [Photobacterium damselae]PSB81360.1 hypothetical protein C5F61_01810 [Photobacterium damselae subsp. damselae]